MQSFFLSKPRIIHLEFRKLVAFNDESKHDSIEKQNSKIDKILVIVMHIMKDRFGFKDTIDYGNDSFLVSFIRKLQIKLSIMNFLNFMKKDLQSWFGFGRDKQKSQFSRCKN